MKFLYTVLISLSFLFSNSIFAQETGSFQVSHQFDEADFNTTRNLYFFVPDDYDAAEAYKIIVGFRGGPHSNAGQFRDQLQPLSDSLNAIILCPENNVEFNNGTEDDVKQLYSYSLEYARSIYNIDNDFIYITGLSYGGRHTIISALDTDAGPIELPIRGIIPFAPGVNSENVADYANSMLFPVCTCIGSLDNSFMNIATTLHSNLVSNGGDAFLNEIPGVGHSTAFVTFPDEMMECFRFIEDQYEDVNTANTDIENNLNWAVFPNPATHFIDIQITSDRLEHYTLEVVNQLGQQIEVVHNLENVNKLDISMQSNGIYFIFLKKDASIVGRKMLVKK